MSAPYPIYKAQNPKHLVDETLAIVRGLTQPTLKSASNFGNQMICIANYFLMKEVREESQNSGKFIEIQGTAEGQPFAAEQLQEMIVIAKNALDKIFELQKKAID